jgi:hypothetical protein
MSLKFRPDPSHWTVPLNSPELPSDEFLTEVSCALSAIEHHFIKHQVPGDHHQDSRTPWPAHQRFCLARRTGPALQTDKMSTLQLKAYSDLTAAPSGRPPVICFWDFPSPGDTVALKVHFAPQHTK